LSAILWCSKTRLMPKKFQLEWLFEPFCEDLSFDPRHMFGCRSAYLDGKLVMVLAENSNDPTWNGVLFPAEREDHEKILNEYPMLVNHKILPKWLYLPIDSEDFEEVAMEISEKIAARDSRFGTLPKEKKRKKKSKASAKKKAKKTVNKKSTKEVSKKSTKRKKANSRKKPKKRAKRR
jgi:hypothetical protein